MDMQTTLVRLQAYIEIIQRELNTIFVIANISQDAIDIIKDNILLAELIIDEAEAFARRAYCKDHIEELHLLANTLTDPDVDISVDDLSTDYGIVEIAYLQILTSNYVLKDLSDRLAYETKKKRRK